MKRLIDNPKKCSRIILILFNYFRILLIPEIIQFSIEFVSEVPIYFPVDLKTSSSPSSLKISPGSFIMFNIIIGPGCRRSNDDIFGY